MIDQISNLKPIYRVLLWLSATLISALAGIVLKAQWDAPRPTTELVSVELMSPKSGSKVALPASLAVNTREHIYFNELESDSSMKDIEEALTRAESFDRDFSALEAKIDALVELLKTRAGSAESRRLDFLLKWSEGGNGETLTRLVKTIVGRKETQLPSHYAQHPKGQEYLVVQLSPQRAMSLSLIDEEQIARGQALVKGPVNVYENTKRDARYTNLVRRLWIYIEPEILIPILEETKQYTQNSVRQSKQIANDIRSTIASQNPPRMVVRVLITNRGADPLPVRNIAALLIRLPGRDSTQNSKIDNESIKILLKDDEELVTIVEGNKSVALTFISAESASDMVRSRPAFQSQTASVDFSTSRLRQLFEGGGIAAAVRLAKAGVPDLEAALKSSDYKPVGPQSRESLYQVLLKP